MKKLFILLIFLAMALPARGWAEGKTTALFPAWGENDKMGYINRAGEWVIPPQFDGAGDFRGDYAAVSIYPEDFDPETGDPWDLDCEGIIDREGNFVLPPAYSLVAGQSGDYFGGKDTGVWLVYRFGDYEWGENEDGEEIRIRVSKYGFFDVPSGCFSGLKWENVWHWCSDSRLIPVMNEDGAGYADRTTGEMVIPCRYFATDPSNFNEGVASVAYVDEDWNPLDFFLIDETGAKIPLPEGIHALYASSASEGRIVVQDEKELLGYADLAGNVVIPPQFLRANDFQDGYASVLFSEGDWGFIDRDGSLVSRGIETDGWRGPDYANGAAIAQTGEDTYTAYTVTGETLFSLTRTAPNFKLLPPMKNGLCWFREYSSSTGFRWGLVDLQGNVVSEAQWKLGDFEPIDFPEGLQAVLVGEKWGFIDETGEIAIPLMYDRAYNFENGLAWVCLDDRCGYIDHGGDWVFSWNVEEEE